MLALVSGATAAFVLPTAWPVLPRMVLAWNVFATVLIAIVGMLLIGASPARTRLRAAADDPGRTVVYSLVVAASAFSLVASTLLARSTHGEDAARSQLLFVFSVWAVVSAWVLTHASFTLRYAHLYYRGTSEGGLTFPGDEKPDDMDFAYFAFTVGMCFQVSDVTVSTREIRRTVLLHALVSFVYNTSILALALNSIFGRVG